MRKYLYEIRFLILIQIICDAVVTLTVALGPYLQKLLFDTVLKENKTCLSFIHLILIYIFCNLIGTIFFYLSMIYNFKCSLKFEMSLKRDFFKSVFNYNYEDFSSRDIGEYISIQGNDILNLEMDYLTPIITIIKAVNMLIIYGIILFVYVDFRIATTIVLISCIAIVIPKLTSCTLSQKRNNYLNEMGLYVSKITDFLQGFKLINSRTINKINAEHEKALNNVKDKRFIYGKFKSFTYSLSELLLNILNAATFIIVGILLFNRKISIGTAVATFGYVNCFVSPLNDILYSINSISSLKDTKNKVIDYINNYKSTTLKYKNDFKNHIVFDHVNFSYNKFNIDDICCKFEKGKKYAIIGHSGSGKSTLINMIMKYTKPLSGKILIDEENVLDLNMDNIVCTINQHEHIFKDDFYNNTTLFSSYPKENLNYVMEKFKCGIFNRIKSEPYSNSLSGGEKQVLAFIRMLTSKSPICIMDEPFSALDVNTTKLLQHNLLNMKDKTVIIVTHDLSENLEKFDKIILMENGKIIEIGDYEEISKSDVFKELKRII